jgi:molybdenum cofactor synthesis domain-containing protein
VKIPTAILTISDSSFQGLRKDLSGPQLRQMLNDCVLSHRKGEARFEIVELRTLPDEAPQIAGALREVAGRVRLIVTTGGTGISARDVTPEATRSVCDRVLEGVAELMRAEGVKQNPFAALSRGICASIGTALIINLPGSPAGAQQSLRSVLHLIPHALDLLAGDTDHG